MAKTPGRTARAGSGDVSFNMTPMIDCTFQLIIFFILASQTANAEYAKGVKVPRPHESEALPGKVMKVPKVVVNVVSMARDEETDDPLMAASAAWYEISKTKYDPGGSNALLEVIRNRKVQAEATGLASEENEFFMEIRADKRVNWQDIAPVIRAGVEAGIKKMNLTALTKQM